MCPREVQNKLELWEFNNSRAIYRLGAKIKKDFVQRALFGVRLVLKTILFHHTSAYFLSLSIQNQFVVRKGLDWGSTHDCVALFFGEFYLSNPVLLTASFLWFLTYFFLSWKPQHYIPNNQPVEGERRDYHEFSRCWRFCFASFVQHDTSAIGAPLLPLLFSTSHPLLPLCSI